MFDANLLNQVCTAKEVFWAGTYPPIAGLTISQRIFDPECDFRQSPTQHGKFEVVYLVECDLGQFKQWPLILDEALRLMRYGACSKLFVRFSQSNLLSLFAFAGFLRKRNDFSFDLLYQESYPDGTVAYGLDCTRMAGIPTLGSFEFALITDGKRPDQVVAFIDSVANVRGIENIEWTIAICGPLSSRETWTRRSKKVRFIEEPGQHSAKGWITRKKNMIIATSTAENLLVVHDRYQVTAAFLEEMFEFGADFSVLVPAQVDTNDQRFPDWVTTTSQWTVTPCGMLPYGDYSPHLYINGGVIISKRHVLIDTPWNDLLFWDQCEDVELTRGMTENGVTPRLARFVKLIVTEARPGYTAGFSRLPMLAHAYPIAQGAYDLAQVSIGSCNVGEVISFLDADLMQLARKGIVIADSEWACAQEGLVPLDRSVGLAFNLEPRGERSLYLELYVKLATPCTTVTISAGGAVLGIEWSDAGAGVKRGISLLDHAVAPKARHVTLVVASSDSVILSAFSIMTADYHTHQYPIKFNSQSHITDGVLGSGWGVLEPWGVWSEGSEATLNLPITGIDSSQDAEFGFTAVAYGPVKGYRQIIGVLCNGVPLTYVDIAARSEPTRFVVRIPRSLIQSSRWVKLSFAPAFPTSPADHGVSDDARKLGIGLIDVDKGSYGSILGWNFKI